MQKLIGLAIFLSLISCSAEFSSSKDVVDFGSILKPHYQAKLEKSNCDKWVDVSVPVFEKSAVLSFRYSECDSTSNGQMVNFTFKPKAFFLEDYIHGAYRFPTPENLLKINPNAKLHTDIDIPIFGITRFKNESVQKYLKERKFFHKVDWDICQIKEFEKNIWTLYNLAYSEVPEVNYLPGNYATFAEFELNHEKDKAEYRDKYGVQQERNRACANEQHNWYVLLNGFMITIPNPESSAANLDPSSIKLEFLN